MLPAVRLVSIMPPRDWKPQGNYVSIMGKIFGIIWKAFCLMQIFNKNLRADLLRMNGNQVMAFLINFTITCKSCQHNSYLGSI